MRTDVVDAVVEAAADGPELHIDGLLRGRPCDLEHCAAGNVGISGLAIGDVIGAGSHHGVNSNTRLAQILSAAASSRVPLTPGCDHHPVLSGIAGSED